MARIDPALMADHVPHVLALWKLIFEENVAD
jgi:hypothetical protein